VARLDADGPAAPPEADGGLEPCHESADREEVAMLGAAFEGAGVPYVLQAGTALSLLDGERLFAGKRADSWHARLWVHAPRLPEAARLLAAVRAQIQSESEAVEMPEALEGETADEFERRLSGESTS
jgi:hypothetical protein